MLVSDWLDLWPIQTPQSTSIKKPLKSNERRLKNAEKTNADLVVQVTQILINSKKSLLDFNFWLRNTCLYLNFKLKNEKQRVLMVEERFSELADNHGELIKSSLDSTSL